MKKITCPICGRNGIPVSRHSGKVKLHANPQKVIDATGQFYCRGGNILSYYSKKERK